MEQILISHHSSRRNYRPKGLDKKRVLQIILLLAICMWLGHQVKNSHHQHEGYNENPQSPSERNITIVLGRRGIEKYKNGANAEFQDTNDSQEYERRDGGVGDDEIDGIISADVENVQELVQEQTRAVNGGDEAIVLAKSYITVAANQDSEMEIGDDSGENIHRVEAFLDENGIPPDASHFINSTSSEPRGRAHES
ncbi:hypothetical protein P3X46_011050 [Hevea brasiliensis]|uniref:DUF4408 domain-containing protein n=2 Tax=Hevea brasiliensis TaxID=3981 RepID=A0ABQ9MIN6_HEVBR|nr:uncharacterized protein LOC110631648 isoform X1 [Hevea brasiliensis]KAJ9179240.1 hypothetical protein P3X46_011050 [Hevea brasiliensis]